MLLCTCWVASAPALTKRGNIDLSLEKLTKLSDEIVIGKVKGKKASFVGRHIETEYDVEVVETLKGTKFGPQSRMQMTVIGGSVTTPPLTEFVEAQPHMVTGEDVALFLKTEPRKLTSEQLSKINPKSRLVSTPRVVGLNQGKFSILTDKNGDRKLTRVNLEERGVLPGDAVLSKTLSAIASGQLKTEKRPVVPARDVPKPGDDRDPLEVVDTKPDANAMKRNADPQRTIGALNSSGPFPVQDFEEFKSQVKSFSQE